MPVTLNRGISVFCSFSAKPHVHRVPVAGAHSHRSISSQSEARAGVLCAFSVFAALWHMWRTSSARSHSAPSAWASVRGRGGGRLECVSRLSDDGPLERFPASSPQPETGCRRGSSGGTDSSGRSVGSAGALKGTVLLRAWWTLPEPLRPEVWLLGRAEDLTPSRGFWEVTRESGAQQV